MKKTQMHFDEFLYGVFDKVLGRYTTYYSALNNAIAVRTALVGLIPIVDREIYCLGAIHVSSSRGKKEDGYQIKPLPASDAVEFDFYKKPVLVSWDSYRLPENLAHAVAPLNLSPDEFEQFVQSRVQESNKDSVNYGLEE